ncbi:MAG TPA: DUF501 domain-containing protein [Candidatus Acetothermia bacterium]|nr:DUF501 domain-containing protein [Candidatus Acetothermia bacterium]
MEPVSLEDKRTIASQIGRNARGVIGIPRRCAYGYPQVVTVYPLLERKPFPTMYWLTCPFLFRTIASLEAGGMIGRLEQEIAANPELAKQVVRAHHSYIEQRRRLLSPDDLAYLEERRMLPALTQRGIGGIADYSRIKCLHLHVAQALVDENPIGRIVLESLAQHKCPRNNILCASL